MPQRVRSVTGKRVVVQAWRNQCGDGMKIRRRRRGRCLRLGRSPPVSRATLPGMPGSAGCRSLAGGSTADGMISKTGVSGAGEECQQDHRAINVTNHGQGRRWAVTSKHTSWQVRLDDCLFRSDSQADSAGSIPVTRST